MEELIIKNKKIVNFYKNNKDLDIETVNLIIIDLLEQLLDGMNTKVNAGINSQILSNVGELNSKVANLSKSMSKLYEDINNSFYIKLQETKKEYMDECKSIMYNNFSQNNEKLTSLLQQNNSHLIDKTTILLNEILPKNSDNIQKNTKEIVENFQKNIAEDSKKILNSLNKDDTLESFLKNFDIKYTQLFQPFQGLINSSEERIQRELETVKKNLFSEPLMKDISDFFGKYKNSSYKGQLGEIQLESVLNQIFPSSEIIKTTSVKAAGDFRINRENKSSLIIETKDYDRNVTLDEVKKFMRDIEEQKCHGVFLSQNSGITSKQNFQIDMVGNYILIYIHNVKYESTVIKMAIDVIDNLFEKLDIINNEDDIDYSITEENLKEIKTEYTNFITTKLNLIENIKESNKKMLSQIDEIKFPCLSKFLTQKCGNILNNENQTILCSICNKFTAQNNKSLAAHQRGCKKRMQIKNEDKIIVNTNNA